ncbi:unnamed protein product [Cuscuta campestris]|uniref:Kelch repeat-containing protein n=1 Tax=Cuscuta campestris TaxID=132261 RepID=A0A484LW91_9ASTE|nr:unnamed protein product [Cuscuta campestris]
MVKSPPAKHRPTKSLILLAFVGVFLVALAVDFTWAPSLFSSTYSSMASVWTRQKHRVVFSNFSDNAQNDFAVESMNVRENISALNRERFSSATFADLPAPSLDWEQMPSAPVPRLDGYSVQIENKLYVFSGYETLDHVHSHVDVYDFLNDTWVDRFDTPKDMAHSHLGIASDGRYVYVITGQYGPQCRAPVSHSFVLDTKTKKWEPFPPLPFPRYAPATQLWRGRLHVMGGSKENRHTPAIDHWSIAVKDGKALEKEWVTEKPIPRGGPHRACVVVDDRLYLIGGQEGDFMAKPGSPIYKCSRRFEVVYGDVYMLDSAMKWKVLHPMPKQNSHIECSWVLVNNSIVIVGGTTEKHPLTKRMMLVGEIFQFNLNTLKWSVIGRLPYRVKTTQAGYWNGWLYFTSGQRDRGPDNPQPRKVIGDMWRTKLNLSS